MDYSRIRSAFYAAISALMPVALYIDAVGGFGNVTFSGLIVSLGSVSGATTAGYHVPSSLSQNKTSLASAIQRIENEPETIRGKILGKLGGMNGSSV